MCVCVCLGGGECGEETTHTHTHKKHTAKKENLKIPVRLKINLCARVCVCVCGGGGGCGMRAFCKTVFFVCFFMNRTELRFSAEYSTLRTTDGQKISFVTQNYNKQFYKAYPWTLYLVSPESLTVPWFLGVLW